MRTRSYNRVVIRRRRRVRARVCIGTALRPRISVFRSNSHMYVQFIDDSAHKTIFSISSYKTKGKRANVLEAKELGKSAAAILKEKSVVEGVFDRGQYRYHGRVKAFADGLREGGIKV